MNTQRVLRTTLASLLALGVITLPIWPAGFAARADRGGQTPAAVLSPQTYAATGDGESAGSRAQDAYGQLPLSFEANRGQADGRADFITRAGGATVFLSPREAAFVLPLLDEGASGAAPRRLHTLRMKIDGANEAPRAEGLDRLPGIVNYFIGDDPSKWQTEIPTFARVRYEDVYDGVDLVYYGAPGRQLEYDFVVSPGADAARVALSFEGADALRVDASSGDLLIETPAGEVRQRRPTVYQEAEGGRREVEGEYELKGGGRVGFRVGEYDRAKSLVIDPVLAYAARLGGSGQDGGSAIAVDAAGSAYVTGTTTSTNFPIAGAFDGTGDVGLNEAFVTKLDARGTALVYSTYFGGSLGDDQGFGIAVDAAGSAYITGATTSTNFPLANAFFDDTLGGGFDAFAMKLSPSGSALVYSTYLGGSSTDIGSAIAVDASGGTYVTGTTFSTNFPVANAFDGTANGISDAFVTKFNPTGTALVYSTFLGGSGSGTSGTDSGHAIAVDASGSAYVMGTTLSANFPVSNAFDGTANGLIDAFVTKFNPTGAALVYSTYLGGSSDDLGRAIAVDAAGGAYVTGTTTSINFPRANAFDETLGGNGDAFVTKLSPSGSALVYSTFLGGSTADDIGRGIAVDASGSAYVTGTTGSDDFPTAAPVQSAYGGLLDAFVTKFNPTGAALVYSTYLGGDFVDQGFGIVADAAGNAYVTGETTSSDFPTTGNALQGVKTDAFVAKLGSYAIAGRVVDPGGVGIHGVNISLSGANSDTTTTDAGGNFLLLHTTPGGNFTVTPTRAGFTFSPQSFAINELNLNQELLFVGTPTATATPTPTPAATPTPSPTPAPVTFQFSASSFGVEEGAGKFQLIVTRSGDTSQPATVDYATTDGTASDRGDYTAAIGRLRFAPGDMARSLNVFVTDDAHVEGNETVQIALSNPSVGGQVAWPAVVLLTIVDNDLAASQVNPADDTGFFVRQHYVDFLGREPDAPGLAFWADNINSCGADADCRASKRVETSAAFFLSIEFQRTGFLVHRLYRAAFNRFPASREFLRDTQETGRGIAVGQGAWEAQLAANQQQLAAEFVQRADFLAVYAGLSDEQYVDALNANTGGSLSVAERNALAAGLSGATETRASVLRKVAEDPDFAAREFNPAFVLMQYFGYLRRNPDNSPDTNFDGFNFWLSKLDSFGGDWRAAELVRAFLLSTEYRSRFGQ
jgi:hypothetical protein